MVGTVLTQGHQAADFILSEANGQRSRDNIIVAAGAGVLNAGTVVGKKTSGGGGQNKYFASALTVQSGEEGSETATAILIYGVDASEADVAVAAITGAAEVNGKCLEYDASVNDDAKKAAKSDQLALKGIKVR